MNALAVILARAGSKGLPHKNQLPVAGKPCLAWTIEHALETPGLDRILLSTDSNEMSQIGRHLGVEVVTRPYEFAHDTATVDAAARHAVTSIIGNHEHIVILYGNVPVRPDDLTQRALDKLIETGCDSVQSVCPVGKHHPYWMKSLTGENDDVMEPYEPNSVYRRQDLPPLYQLDGGVIAVTRESLFKIDPANPHAFLGTDRRVVVTEPGEVIDIDEAKDLIVAEATLKLQAEERGRAAG
ncbi:acylneuraminate cytidylyltransferase family protein [Algisphaera agarilytica]|uniref:CMP-N-acetylneuraminic acid synthetase n=1 Tax=Algisphaera agarilytica TaxID=1385975 RepID=A0A7X0H8L0_9BACT|nr:acylneuraminate cytidylyltransferase family protein [Algisphaera agarilytica]MBB6429804.1 CMP-N-acetylneuraminic acid synthetase [Algisphaera agarilytica]